MARASFLTGDGGEIEDSSPRPHVPSSPRDDGMFGDQDGAPEIDRGFEVEFRRRDIGESPVGGAENGGAVDHDVKMSSFAAGGDRFETGDDVRFLRDIDDLAGRERPPASANSETVALMLASFRSKIVTSAPPRRRAIALPMPSAPPVITAD